jgi:hypothetical protein
MLTIDECSKVIKQAADRCGGEEELARRLGVPSKHVRRWVEGEALPPLAMFFTAQVIARRSGTTQK